MGPPNRCRTSASACLRPTALFLECRLWSLALLFPQFLLPLRTPRVMPTRTFRQTVLIRTLQLLLLLTLGPPLLSRLLGLPLLPLLWKLSCIIPAAMFCTAPCFVPRAMLALSGFSFQGWRCFGLGLLAGLLWVSLAPTLGARLRRWGHNIVSAAPARINSLRSAGRKMCPVWGASLACHFINVVTFRSHLPKPV